MFKMKNVSKLLLGAAIVVLASCGGETADAAASNADSLAKVAEADSLAKVAADAAAAAATTATDSVATTDSVAK
jgi:hypothetical protein